MDKIVRDMVDQWDEGKEATFTKALCEKITASNIPAETKKQINVHDAANDSRQGIIDLVHAELCYVLSSSSAAWYSDRTLDCMTR
jgi:hypothetical protein